MSTASYSFVKDKDSDVWSVYDTQFGGGDKTLTKEFMKEFIYDRFQAILPEDMHADVDKCRVKLPAYLQFDGQLVNSDAGVLNTTLELYIRKNTIETANMIVKGTQGSVARIPVGKFKLTLPFMDLNPDRE